MIRAGTASGGTRGLSSAAKRSRSISPTERMEERARHSAKRSHGAMRRRRESASLERTGCFRRRAQEAGPACRAFISRKVVSSSHGVPRPERFVANLFRSRGMAAKAHCDAQFRSAEAASSRSTGARSVRAPKNGARNGARDSFHLELHRQLEDRVDRLSVERPRREHPLPHRVDRGLLERAK